MVVWATFLHAGPTLAVSPGEHGDAPMKNRMTTLLIGLAAALAWSSSAQAACNGAEFAGTWEVAFSDGNSCQLVLDMQGDLIAEESLCFDPFRGRTAPDSGSYAVASDCSVSAVLVVEGVTVEPAAQFARTRAIGAGRFVVPAYGFKGGVTMVRMP